jgi:formate hydrogenlyase subunit 3/multisubunit Na+/H+ antiporter MnhD subunit
VDAQAILTVGAAVVALTQLVKWGGVPDKFGVIVVIALAILGTAVWAYSQPAWDRADTFGYFAGAIAVMTSAAGVFGFTRAGSDAVTRTKGPPAGAGQNPTEKV